MHDSLPIAGLTRQSAPGKANQSAARPQAPASRRRMLIIGNGPSTRRLAERGFDALPADVDTFGMGAAYRHFERVGWWPTYYALADSKVVHSHRAALARLIDDQSVSTKRFYFSLPISQSDRFVHIPHSSTGDFCFRKAIELGYREIYLIGIEGSYVEEIAESRPLTDEEFAALGFETLNLPPEWRKLLIVKSTPAQNPNYFFDDYQREGDVYSPPQSSIHQNMWSRSASGEIAQACRVFNLSDQSKVTDFPLLSLEDFLAGEPTASEENLQKEFNDLVASVPTKSPIFLPTDRLSLRNKVAGMRRVHDLYERRLESVYKPKLQALRKQYAGRRRCFILGNGPSLARTDLSVLKNEITFVTNGFFLKAPELDWTPTFYVVEDHLVAEDRRDWIHAFKGPTKFFPAYLAYCLNEDDDTIFLNHRARKRAPHAFDFSRQADEITYAGCTVTFTCLQLAHYFGFKETYLLGVDADYDIPADAKDESSYGVGVLDMKSDDPNHFHPDYFGKGFRWHNPQVEKMVQAYEEARRVVDQTDQRIYNAGVGGKLEVFERRPLQTIFSRARSPEAVSAAPKQVSTVQNDLGVVSPLPKVLVFDLTPIGNGTATGELKATMFEGWPETGLMQITGSNTISVIEAGRKSAISEKGEERLTILRERIATFEPDLILYRPAAWGGDLHEISQTLIRESGLPYVVWVMDDIAAIAAQEEPARFDDWDRQWRALLAGATRRLSIGKAMSEAFKDRYGLDFEPIANGVDPDEWPLAPEKSREADKHLTLRYGGSIVPYMQQETLRLVARAVEAMADNGAGVRFEIRSRHEQAAEAFKEFKHTSFSSASSPIEAYRAWLREADILLIGYNFDSSSADYTRYSVANKLPECMAAGAALLAVGPRDAATIAHLEELDCGVRTVVEDQAQIIAAIESLMKNAGWRRELGANARRLAFEHHNVHDIRARFHTILVDASKEGSLGGGGLPRSACMRVDETAVAARLLAARRGKGHVMLDVGAHVGSTAALFDQFGWSIFAFEPDPKNREKIRARFANSKQIVIDPRAVSDAPATGVAFFSSPVSAGISSLSAFHESHTETARVDVTTVRDVVAEYGIGRVDFLKIDVEGFDLSVLKGVPWETLRPDVIECEFEDAKTLALGHSWRDIAEFLRAKGYSVYVSEWHPIVRYGGRHEWRRVSPFPGVEVAANAWGNLLAFREDPGYPAVRAAFKALAIKQGPPKPAAPPAPPPPAQHTLNDAAKAPAPLRFYAPYAERLRTASPPLFALARFGKKVLGSLWRRRAYVAPAALVFAGWVVAGFIPALASLRWLIWGSAAFAFLFGALTYVAFRVRQFMERAAIENAAWRNTLHEAHNRMLAFESANALLAQEGAKQRKSIAGLRSRLAQTADLAAALADTNEALDRRLADTSAKFDKRVGALSQKLDAALAATAKDMDARTRALGALKIELEETIRRTGADAAQQDARILAELEEQRALLAQTVKFTQVDNSAWYQRFNRRLESEHVEVLTRWAVQTPAKATKQAIGYAAHHACTVERRMRGRLAASIEDILLRTFAAMSVQRSSLNVLEIGSLFGISAAVMYDIMAPHYEKLHFTLIDPLDGYYAADQLDVLTGQPITEAVLRRNLEEVGLAGESLTLIKHLSTSPEALSAASEQEYDVLVIDGDHSYEGVKADFERYAPLVRRGGVIIFDDYNAKDWPDVARFVDTEVEKLDFVGRVGDEWRTCIFRVVRPPAGRRALGES